MAYIDSDESQLSASANSGGVMSVKGFDWS